MHNIQFDISKPTNEDQFEDMCAIVYGELFGDPTPQKNGRRGQGQFGVDIFVRSSTGTRIGVQSKRYADGRLNIKHVVEEVDKADKGIAISRLIVATTAANDAALIQAVQKLSDEREAQGKFPVQLDGWDDICRHIRTFPRLQNHYAPNAPGAAFFRADEQFQALTRAIGDLASISAANASMPAARADSTNRFVSAQLDGIADVVKACRFQEAFDSLTRLGADMSVFDTHQQARWHYLRGNCTWHLGSLSGAASDLLKATELYPDDDKIAAGGARAFLLQGEADEAVRRGKVALTRWPVSLPVWLVYANAAMVAGEPLGLDDVPVNLRDNADVLQTLAWGKFRQGDLVGAVELALAGARGAGAGFFSRATALGLALQKAAGTPSAYAFGAVAPADLDNLRAAVDQFADRGGRLWNVQAQSSVDETAGHLAMAFIVLKRFDDALAVVTEARARGRLTGALVRHEMDVLRDEGQAPVAIARGRQDLALLQPEGLALLGEIAAHEGDVACVEALTARAEEAFPSEGKLHDALWAMRILALWRSRRRDDVVSAVMAADLVRSASVTRVAAGARFMLWANQSEEAEALIDRAVELLDSDAPEEARIVVAEMLFGARRYAQAIPLYAAWMRQGEYSELHDRLLCCYVRSGARRKARELLASLPEGWMENDSTRSLAIELANSAADFPLMDQLADVELRHAPDTAGSWTFKLSVALRTRTHAEVTELVAQIPEALEGDPRQHAQLAGADFRFGDKAKGMRRLYRQYRRDIESGDAAASYVIPIVGTSERLPNLEDSLDTVVPGVTVTLVNELGATLTVPIDPNDVDVPPSSKYLNAQAPEVAPLLGSKVGDEVTLPGSMAHTRTYRVAAIRSTYRHLLDHAHGVVSGAVKPIEHLASIPVATKDGQPDFSYMQEQLTRIDEHSERVFDAYREGIVTLGVCAQLHGKNNIELVATWGTDWPTLQVSLGTADELKAAAALLEDRTNVYVVDTSTLCELARIDCLKALASLPKVLVTATTRDIVMTELDESQNDKSVGRTGRHNGQLYYVESTQQDKAQRVAFVQSIADAISSYCEVLPAYGPAEPAQGLVAAGEVLQADEYSSMLLAAERGAVLFSLDWRLRGLASTLGIRGIWVQPVLRQASRDGTLTLTEYVLSNFKQLLANRGFIPLTAADVALICQQGEPWLQQGVQVFKDFIANGTTEQNAAFGVIGQLLMLVPQMQMTWPACGELVSHLAEAVFRRADVFVDATERLQSVALRLVRAAVTEPMEALRVYHFLVAKIQEGADKAREKAGPRPVDIIVDFGRGNPQMRYGKVRASVGAADENARANAPDGAEQDDAQ